MQYPFYSWPAYDYTSNHISNLNAQCKKVLQSYGLRESSSIQKYEKRIFCDVFVYLAYTSDEERLRLLETLADNRTNKTFYNPSSKKCVSLQEICKLHRSISSVNDESRELVFIIVNNSRIKETGLPSSHPRLNLIRVHIEQQKSCVRHDENVLSHLYDDDKTVLRTIDDRLEKYSFETVRCKAKYFHYLWNMHSSSAQPVALTDVTEVDLEVIDEMLYRKSKLHYLFNGIYVYTTCSANLFA